jgi:hypothetical protein
MKIMKNVIIFVKYEYLERIISTIKIFHQEKS